MKNFRWIVHSNDLWPNAPHWKFGSKVKNCMYKLYYIGKYPSASTRCSWVIASVVVLVSWTHAFACTILACKNGTSFYFYKSFTNVRPKRVMAVKLYCRFSSGRASRLPHLQKNLSKVFLPKISIFFKAPAYPSHFPFSSIQLYITSETNILVAAWFLVFFASKSSPLVKLADLSVTWLASVH